MAVSGLAVLALTAACTGGSAKPRTLPSITPTTSASPTPVAIPSEATVHNAFGAAAFVRFYYAQLNAAWSMPDPGQLGGLSDPACQTCTNYVKAAQRFLQMGQHIRGNSVAVVSAEAPPEQNGLVAVDVVFDEPARAIVDAAGKIVKSFPETKRLHWTVYVKRQSAGWVLRAAVKNT